MSRKTPEQHHAEQVRLQRANALIVVIAGTGRRFLSDNGVSGYLDMSERGRVRYHHPSGAAVTVIDLHARGSFGWKVGGGTMATLLTALRVFIKRGTAVTHLGPWPAWYSGGDPWGYGCDMVAVRSVAFRLGITAVL